MQAQKCQVCLICPNEGGCVCKLVQGGVGRKPENQSTVSWVSGYLGRRNMNMHTLAVSL